MLDLNQFCEKEGLRYYLQTPCSRGDYTFASNGHIIVRVARRDDIGEVDAYPNTDRLMKLLADGPYIAPPSGVPIPPNVEEEDECPECDGSGKEHQCPSCTCVCEKCNGTGKVSDERIIEVRVGASIFNGKYIAMMLAIEGVEICVPTAPEDALSFRFPEGVGLIMARRVDKHDVCLIPEAEPA